MNLRNKTYSILRQILIAGSIITFLFINIVACGSDESSDTNNGNGNNGAVVTVDITQADIDRLKDSWQETLNTMSGGGAFIPNNSYSVDLMLSELYTGNITSTEKPDD